jgi:hypothetical protein
MLKSQLNPGDTTMTFTESIAALKWRIPKNSPEFEDKAGEFLTFVTKEQYLQFRTEWRALYAELSIRARTGLPSQGSTLEMPWNSRELRRFLLEIRRQSKILAQAQYLASKLEIVKPM